jgi:hypothetical protein
MTGMFIVFLIWYVAAERRRRETAYGGFYTQTCIGNALVLVDWWQFCSSIVQRWRLEHSSQAWCTR